MEYGIPEYAREINPVLFEFSLSDVFLDGSEHVCAWCRMPRACILA